MSLLDVEGLVVRYGRGADAFAAVDGVDLHVPAGGTVGVVGESGCGKSTIARALTGLVPTAAGRITLDGRDYSSDRSRTRADYRRAVQMVFQDPTSSLNPRMTVGRILADAVGRQADPPGRSGRRAEVSRLLDLVRLPANTAERYPHQFSGGQKQRIAIARALAVKPRLVICDEVTSALDVSVQATVVNLLRDLQRELGIGYVFISHDLSVVRAMSDTVSVMYLGRVVENARGDQLFEEPLHPYTNSLITSVPTLAAQRRPAPLSGELPDPRRPPAGCRFHTRCPIGPLADETRTRCATEDPTESAGKRLHSASCHYAPEDEQAPPADVPSDRLSAFG